jgi:hypothetical protein
VLWIKFEYTDFDLGYDTVQSQILFPLQFKSENRGKKFVKKNTGNTLLAYTVNMYINVYI